MEWLLQVWGLGDLFLLGTTGEMDPLIFKNSWIIPLHLFASATSIPRALVTLYISLCPNSKKRGFILILVGFQINILLKSLSILRSKTLMDQLCSTCVLNSNSLGKIFLKFAGKIFLIGIGTMLLIPKQGWLI